MALTRAQIEAAVSGSKEDMRRTLLAMFNQFELLNAAAGLNFLAPTNSPLNPSTQPPGYATVSIVGANGIYTIGITNPSQNVNTPIYHQLQYSTEKTFMVGVQTLPTTSATSLPFPAPGSSFFWRYRSSFDRVNWNEWRVVSSAAISSGLQSSGATNPNLLLNQSNFANVTSRDPGTGVVQIQVGSPSNPYFNFLSQRGGAQAIRPSATIVNVTPGSTQFLAWDGAQYLTEPQIPNVLDDGLEPIGVVNVVGTGAFALPTVAAFRSAGGLLGYLITSAGNGICSLLNWTITDGTGTGATVGAQTITAGKLVNLAPGTPGSGYSVGVTVTALGGTYSDPGGGGGGFSGGNGARLFQNPLGANLN